MPSSNSSKSPVSPSKQTDYVGSIPPAIAVEGRLFLRKGDLDEYAAGRATQLSCLLELLYGGGGDTFRSYSDNIQENVLWLAAGLAQEVRDVLDLIGEVSRKEAGI